MSWIVLKQPHPLDGIWSVAMAAVEEAQAAIDALASPYTNGEIDALVDKHSAAAQALLALPARDVADCITKLDLTGPLDGGQIMWADRNAITNEMLTLIDAAVHRGEKIKKIMPDFLEGVTL
ncbi:MAG: hypothetical protein CL949_01805 [Erythrobacter sp.]|nr:hypothetical protein [Erythrobacter sp.]|tara:strand:+ start:11030 stop:11395 length:366 start_codon:yes stop_codon:yes gene_type:complete